MDVLYSPSLKCTVRDLISTRKHEKYLLEISLNDIVTQQELKTNAVVFSRDSFYLSKRDNEGQRSS